MEALDYLRDQACQLELVEYFRLTVLRVNNLVEFEIFGAFTRASFFLVDPNCAIFLVISKN